MIFTIDLEVSANEIENNYSHLHHADALRFFERSRVAFIDQIDCSLQSFKAEGLFLVVSRIDVLYRREVKAGLIKVTCESADVNEKVLRISQRLYNEKNKLAVDAVVDIQFLDTASGRAVKVPTRFVTALETYKMGLIDS